MKTKSFKEYLDTRLSKAEIKQIEQAAKIEFEVFSMLQSDISKALAHYMSESNIGFNELVRQLGKSPTQVSRIIKGEANLTLATIAQLYALMGQRVHLVAA